MAPLNMTIRDPYRTSFPIFFPPFKDAQALVTAPSRTCYRSQGAYIPEDYYQFLSGAKASSHAGNISLPGVGLISQDPFSLDGVSRVPKSPSRAYL